MIIIVDVIILFITNKKDMQNLSKIVKEYDPSGVCYKTDYGSNQQSYDCKKTFVCVIKIRP